MMNIFINHTNHPSVGWTDKQRAAAAVYGNIVDVPFPDINPEWDGRRVRDMAHETFEAIKKTRPAAVLCQGEAVYSFELVRLLKNEGIKVLAASSRRDVKEKLLEDGANKKEVYFRFVCFREY